MDQMGLIKNNGYGMMFIPAPLGRKEKALISN
jgi:hypothetical protein